MSIWKKLQEILSKTKEKSPGADVRIRREKKSSAKDRSIMTDKCNWWIQFCAEGYAAGTFRLNMRMTGIKKSLPGFWRSN